MKVASISSTLLADEGRRLGPRAFVDGSIAVRKRIRELPHRRLSDVTAGFKGGIFTHSFSPKRTYVSSRAYGVPFLGAASMLLADLSGLPLISNKDAESRSYRSLAIREGMTLISCSGSVGRMAYARADMDGMISAGDILKVQPDPETILPGFLHAFLSSRYGRLLVNAGTYGTIVQHLEPQHIADLPVPRLGDDVEESAHHLMEEAALLRAEGAEQIARTVASMINELELSLERGESVSCYSINTISSRQLNGRLDAPYHSRAAARAEEALDNSPAPSAPLAEVVKRYFKPPMFKRLWVEDPAFGRQFISGVDAYRYQAESIRYVSHKTPNFDEFILEEGMVIFQAAGQIYGLFGQPLFVSGWLSGLFAADDLYRLKPHNPSDGGFIFAFLRTPVGQILLKRQACGNSIPRVWDPHIRGMSVPWPEEAVRVRIGSEIIEAHARIERARVAEVQAVALVERAIEEAP